MLPREEWHLDTLHLGRRVLLFECLDSTSTYAAQLADAPENDGIVILADQQSAGRGQQGRRWLCPAGSGVLMSVRLSPPPAVRHGVTLAAWAAVGVCETIRRTTGLEARIKWPNDVLLEGRKVAGVLIEQAQHTIVGIGLNVRQTDADFRAAALPDAAALACYVPQPPSVAEVARTLIIVLDADYAALLGGDRTALESRWRALTGLLGKSVAVETIHGRHLGRLLDLRCDAVELMQPDGKQCRLAPERVRHLREIDEGRL